MYNLNSFNLYLDLYWRLKKPVIVPLLKRFNARIEILEKKYMCDIYISLFGFDCYYDFKMTLFSMLNIGCISCVLQQYQL